MERPKMEDHKSICYWCKHAQVLDAERVERGFVSDPMGRPILNPISQQPMVEERHIFNYVVICHARGAALPLNPESTIHQCTDFNEMETVPALLEPEDRKKESTETVN